VFSSTGQKSTGFLHYKEEKDENREITRDGFLETEVVEAK
jgi:hypothetical protein